MNKFDKRTISKKAVLKALASSKTPNKERLDKETILICFVSLVAIWMLLTLIDMAFIVPYAEENALEECSAKGYQSFYKYSRVFLSKDAIGVKCEEPIKHVIIEGNGSVVINFEEE